MTAYIITMPELRKAVAVLGGVDRMFDDRSTLPVNLWVLFGQLSLYADHEKTDATVFAYRALAGALDFMHRTGCLPPDAT